MAIAFTDLFARLGKIIDFQDKVNTARGTTIPPEVKECLDAFNGDSLAIKRAIAGMESADQQFKDGAAAATSAARQAFQQAVIEFVDADTPLSNKTITAALRELTKQMVDNAQTVNACGVSVSSGVSVIGTGDSYLIFSEYRGDGRKAELLIPESLLFICTDDAADAATFATQTSRAIGDLLSSDWPAGSGTAKSFQLATPATSLLTNSDFDDATVRSSTPDGWDISTGTIGTTFKMTHYEVQTITISGTPTTGSYCISWANSSSKTQQTTPLAYNAGQAAVQAALRALVGLENIDVITTGTTPNYTHTITFTGVAGNVAQVTIVNNLTGGTITPGTTTAGSANAFTGMAVEFDSDGAEYTTFQQRVTLQPLTQYAFCLQAMADVVPASGVITIDLTDGISGGTGISDEQGNPNVCTFACNALTTSFVPKAGIFRTPKNLPPLVYFRIRISTVIPNGTSVFLDHLALTKMTELYAGGPSIAAFAGKTRPKKGDAQNRGSYFFGSASNDLGGLFQVWFHRNCDMAAKGLLLPSNSIGGETLSDALIS